MSWFESHIVQLAYIFDFIGQIMPIVLTVAVIFTFFLVQSFSKKLSRISFYLDRIDNHLREITYFIKDYQKEKLDEGQNADNKRQSDQQRG
ncbi:MAG TPA: hypothetical protein VM123_03955 [archaeon]|nr:hypothetical protein [archaeon]